MDERVNNEPVGVIAKVTETPAAKEKIPKENPVADRTPVEGFGKAKRNVCDLICFSHLRWDFVFQRPQHLMTRASRHWRIFFFEEPIMDNTFRIENRRVGENVWQVIPHLPCDLSDQDRHEHLRKLVDQMIDQAGISEHISWYYTPMAMPFSDHLSPAVTVYDCMDELSAFRGAPPQLVEQEERLLEMADVVLTGGQSLYEARKHRHKNIHPFPSSIDRAHFGKARQPLPDPTDQRPIEGPRLGFFGVIDERFDIDLVAELAGRRPDWQLVLIGPVVKICPDCLPKAKNIHYLGMKSYQELPSYVCHWDVAMLPFAINESTRFISPTKTPEYLAAGKPVVSTPIRDVIRPYEENGLVAIADTAEAFEKAIETALNTTRPARELWLAEVDAFLATTSWDQTWSSIHQLVKAPLLVKSLK
ncbi:glycosyltransferase family 1 protein [Larkinella soli]|uniref:glycosyltransferase family 1 protein n=1 Tax=Larkinella soli TaxID=1770527 RepID=UPI000FFB2D99|nr:glycosyltransferase family 1 protein [Larkinella soli]